MSEPEGRANQSHAFRRAAGYRAYHWTQLSDAAIVRRLRSLDLPLEHVQEVLEARDPDVTRRVLARHEAVMRERLDDVTRIVAELQAGVERPITHTPVEVRDAPSSHTLAFRGRVTEAEFDVFLGQAYEGLYALAARIGVVPSGPAGALYPPEIADDGVEDVEAYLPLREPVALPRRRGSIVLSEVPAARVAVVSHDGPYDTIGDTYRQLGAWVARHATPAGEPVREIYLVSYQQTDDPERFRTEIHWPVTKGKPHDATSGQRDLRLRRHHRRLSVLVGSFGAAGRRRRQPVLRLDWCRERRRQPHLVLHQGAGGYLV